MKTRTGFVSNSSSSSFIILGVKITSEEAETKLRPSDYDAFDVIYDDDQVYCGDLIQNSDGDYLENGSRALGDLRSNFKAQTAAHKLDIKDVKLYYGTRAC
jgi:hypothetical protein